MNETFRINRAGCLAVHLMPKYHGEKLFRSVKRIIEKGPKDKFEHGAVMRANLDDCEDEPFKVGRAIKRSKCNGC